MGDFARSTVTLFAVALSACGTTATAPAPVARPAAAPVANEPLAPTPIAAGAHVVIRTDRFLRTAPMANADRFRVGGGTAKRPLHRLFEVVSQEGPWVQVRAAAGRGCVPTLTPLAEHGLRFSVRRGELASVAQKTMRTQFANDTFVELRVGVPIVGRRTDGWGLVKLSDAMLAAPVDWKHVDDAFKLTPATEEDDFDNFVEERAVWSLSADARLSIADGERIELDASPSMVDVHKTRDGFRAEYENNCFAVRARVAPTDVESGQDWGLSLSGTGGAGGPFVRKGAKVYWSDGSVAGETQDGIAVSPSWFEPEGGRACRDLEVAGEAPVGERTLRVCFDPSDVFGLPNDFGQ